MQPPPGFGGPNSSVAQQTNTAAQSHNKLISAGPEIESMYLLIYQSIKQLNNLLIL